MPFHSRSPWPAVTAGQVVESLSALPPDAPVHLIEVSQEAMYGGTLVTTLTLKVYGDVSLVQRRHPQTMIKHNQKALPAKVKRLT